MIAARKGHVVCWQTEAVAGNDLVPDEPERWHYGYVLHATRSGLVRHVSTDPDATADVHTACPASREHVAGVSRIQRVLTLGHHGRDPRVRELVGLVCPDLATARAALLDAVGDPRHAGAGGGEAA